MTRQILIEQLRRQIYGGFPVDEAVVTDNLVNSWINYGCALAAKQNYKDNLQIEAVGFVNNSFYTTFKGLAIEKDEQFLYKITLPQIPLGIGYTEGISTLLFKDSTGKISYPGIPISENQKGYFRSMRAIPNKILFYPEGIYCYCITPLITITDYTATVSMISAGDATDLNSTLNIPDDYIPTIITYIQQQLLLERSQPQDTTSDGLDEK